MEQSTFHCAYNRCLELESHHDQIRKQYGSKLQVLVCARFLGHMIIEAPTDSGRNEFASEVIRCSGPEQLQALADLYMDHILCCFCYDSQYGECSFGSDDYSSSWSDEEEEDIHELAKKKALERDHYRCIFTRRSDIYCVSAGLVELDTETPGPWPWTTAQAAHIFGRSSKDVEKQGYSASAAYAALSRFGGIETSDEDEPYEYNIHRLENILTLSADIFAAFGLFYLWLERNPNDPINQYRPASIMPSQFAWLPNEIKLTTPDPQRLPLPDSRYLALRAACTRAVNMSGARDCIDQALHDVNMEDMLEDIHI